MEQILSRPPHATKLPEGAYAHVITQLDRRGMAWICVCMWGRGVGGGGEGREEEGEEGGRGGEGEGRRGGGGERGEEGEAYTTMRRVADTST